MSDYANWEFKMKPISRTFVKGLIAIIPITLTVYLLFWMAGAAELALGKIFKFFFPDAWYINGMGFILGLVVVFFFGSFLESQTFRRMFRYFEELVIQIPFVKSIYTAIRDISSLFSSEQKEKFNQVVLVKVAPGNSQQVGFITVSNFEESLPALVAEDHVAVFIPFSYQLGGMTLIMPRKNVVEIDISVEDALRFIATAGVVSNVTDDNLNID
jgi:uncharacterized membrane protein